MSGLGFYLKAKNSSSDMKLIVEKNDDGTVYFCLLGSHECNKIQIDFDVISKNDAIDLSDYISMKAAK